MKQTVANGKSSSILDGLDLDNALKKTDEQGNVFYSLYVDSDDPLSLVNISLNDIEGALFGRVLYQQIDEAWLLEQDVFPGWGSYTGTFTVTDLEGEVLYEANVDNGSSASEVSTNGRAYCISELMKTQKVCIPSLDICYPTYEWITSCEWFWAGGNYIGSGGSTPTTGSSGSGSGSNTVGEGVGVYNPKFADEDISDLVAEIEANKANDWEDKIDDTQLDPCSKEIFSKLKTLQTNDIANILIHFGDLTSNYDWTIKTGTPNQNKNVAATNWTKNGVYFDYTTVIASSYSNQATEMAIARTILHEMVHASLLSHIDDFKTGNTEDFMNFVVLWHYIKQTEASGNTEAAQHEFMAAKYITPLKEALKEMDGGAQKDLYYEDLAWGSLLETETFEYFHPKGTLSRKRISDTNLAEDTNTAKGGISPKGKPCL